MIGQINITAYVWSQWMGNMFWQVSLFIVLIMFIDMAIRRSAWPHVRYVLWGLVFLKLLIPPTWQMPTGIVPLIQPKVSEYIPVQIENTPWLERSLLTSEIDEQSQHQVAESVTVEKATWHTTLFLIWIAGMLFFVLMLAIQMSRLPKRSQRQYDRDAPKWFYTVLGSASSRLRLKKTPFVIFSREARSPAVFGLFRPALVLPREYFDHLTREQAEHVLHHELCHIKRGDLWVHWFCILLQIVYWFNPLLILARRQLGHVSEICCDLTVANVLKEKTAAYRETLLSISRRFLADAVKPGLGLLGIFEEPSRIVARLKWLELKTWENRKRKIVATIFTILATVVFVMPMSGRSQPSEKNKELPIQSPADDGSSAAGDSEAVASMSLKQKEAVFLVSGEPVVAQEAGKTTSASNAASDSQGGFILNMVDTDIMVLIETISKITGKTFIIDSNVKGKVNLVSSENITKDEAYRLFETVLEIYGFALEPAGKFIKVVPVSTATPGEAERRISLKRSQLDNAMENQIELMTQFIMPYSEAGVEGLVLSNIKPNSFFRRMGFRNGDVLVTMDDQPLTTVDQMAAFFEKLKLSDTASLELYRRGRVRTMNYQIQ